MIQCIELYTVTCTVMCLYTCTIDWEILKSVIFRTIKDLIFSSISSYEITEKKKKKSKFSDLQYVLHIQPSFEGKKTKRRLTVHI